MDVTIALIQHFVTVVTRATYFLTIFVSNNVPQHYHSIIKEHVSVLVLMELIWCLIKWLVTSALKNVQPVQLLQVTVPNVWERICTTSIVYQSVRQIFMPIQICNVFNVLLQLLNVM